MHRNFILFACLILRFLVFELGAQSVSFWAPKDSVAPSTERYRADIQVTNFRFIVGTQFNLSWDSTLLQLDSVGNFGLPLKLEDHFGLVSKSKGLLSFQWFDESLKGVTLADRKVIFSLYFKVKGPRGVRSPLNFVDTPTNIRETADSSYKAVTAFYLDGFVDLRPPSTTAVSRINPNVLFIHAIYPNPVSNGEVNLSWYAVKPGASLLTLTDIRGSILRQWSPQTSAGNQTMTLSLAGLPAGGLYQLHLKQGNIVSSRQILYMPPD